MKKPVNFETITFQKYKFLGINWEIRVEGLAPSVNGDYSRVWLLPDMDGERQIGRAFYFDIYWDKNKCEVFVPLVGEGDSGPHIKDYPIQKDDFKTSDIFKGWLSDLVADILNQFNIKNKGGVMGGFTPLSFAVKSDNSDTEYAVEYMNGNWSCTCKGFVYSKTTPQSCKHITKQLSK